MSTISRPARDWHLGDILLPATGTPRVITMHRLEGAAPAIAVVRYGSQHHQHYLPLDHTELIARSD